METFNWEKFQIYTARFFTILFHPLFMPAYGLIIIFTAPTLFYFLPPPVKKILLLVVVINNIMVPVALIPFFRYRNIISSWKMDNRSDRVIPLLSVSILYFITSFIVARFGIPLLIKAYIHSVSILSLAILIINFRYKISIHSAGAGALTGLVISLGIVMGENLILYLIPVLLVSGLIMTSRLKLNVHNPGQVYSGFLAGFAVITSIILLFQ